MAINKLELPDWSPTPTVDWSPLSQIGQSIADWRNKRAIAQAVQQAGGDANLAGQNLGAAGFTDQARPYLSLAQQEAALKQQAQFHGDTVAQQRAALEESRRHALASEGLQAEAMRKNGFMQLPDGTILRTNPNAGTAEPIYSATPKPMPVQPGTTLVNPTTGEPVYKNDTSELDPITLREVAAQLNAGDKSVLANWGRGQQGPQNLIAIRKEAVRQNQEANVSGATQALKNAEYTGLQAGQRVLGTQEAKIGSAASEARGAMELARGAIEKVPRTSFLPLNYLIQGYQKNTLNPDQAELYTRLQGVKTAYASAMARGGSATTEGAQHRAEELLNSASNPEVLNRVLDTMDSEMKMAEAAPEKMRAFYRQHYGDKVVPKEGEKPEQKSEATALPKFNTPQEAWAAMKAGKLKSGDRIQTPDGQIIELK